MRTVLQIMNIWVESKPVKEFVLGQKLGRIASELMRVSFSAASSAAYPGLQSCIIDSLQGPEYC